jgi:hypothetical protein
MTFNDENIQLLLHGLENTDSVLIMRYTDIVFVMGSF